MDYNKIVSLVYEARRIVFNPAMLAEVSMKNPYDYVTAVDTEISNFMKERLHELYPDIGFMTEEEQEHRFSGRCFILDPIDGTTNLLHGYQMSSISLAYAEDGKTVFGVVFNPFTKEMFFSVKGKGAHLYKTDRGITQLLSKGVENYTANSLSVSNRKLSEAVIEFGAGSSKKHLADSTFGRAKRVFTSCLDLRRICSTALAISYVAAGRIDGYFEQFIHPWDYAAAILFLEEAGGKSSNWQSEPLPLDKDGSIVCTNGVFHNELIDILNGGDQ